MISIRRTRALGASPADAGTGQDLEAPVVDAVVGAVSGWSFASGRSLASAWSFRCVGLVIGLVGVGLVVAARLGRRGRAGRRRRLGSVSDHSGRLR